MSAPLRSSNPSDPFPPASCAPTRRSCGLVTLPLLLAAGLAWPADAEDPPSGELAGIETIQVTGRREEAPGVQAVEPADVPPFESDTAGMLYQLPGGAVGWNGPLTGEVQLRGLTGIRVPVRVDGIEIDPGGPNRMDPPLQYAPRPLLERLEVRRGIAPVSDGAETVGGAARVELQTSRFGSSQDWQPDARATITGRSNDESISAGGVVSGANRRFRVHALGAVDHGDDYDSRDGTVRPSQYRRWSVGGGAGVRFTDHDLGADYRRSETDDTGTPPLPMDIRYVRSNLADVKYQGWLGELRIDADASLLTVDHEMDDYRLRPAGANRRYSKADGSAYGFGLRGTHPLALPAGPGGQDGELRAGVELWFTNHHQDIYDADLPAFFVHNFDHVDRDRYGAFVEWSGHPLESLELEVGVRYTRVQSDAGPVDATPAQMMPPAMALRDAFNAADRDRGDDLVDAVARLSWRARPGLRLELEGGRKTRAPSYIERYAWLPLEVSGGLADGNVYVGALGLDPEVFYEIGGGFTLEGDGYSLSPRAFYKRADDYIQGRPSQDPNVIATANAIGIPPYGAGVPLQFSNVDAELWGVDVEGTLRGPMGLQLDGVLSWVRGRERHGGRDLYRIAPLRLQTTLSWTHDIWRVAVEGVVVARQDHVAKQLGERATSGYGLLNLYASVRPLRQLRIDLGVENVLDDGYRDHLAAINRAAGSGVAVGAKLPGRSIGGFGRVSVEW